MAFVSLELSRKVHHPFIDQTSDEFKLPPSRRLIFVATLRSNLKFSRPKNQDITVYPNVTNNNIHWHFATFLQFCALISDDDAHVPKPHKRTLCMSVPCIPTPAGYGTTIWQAYCPNDFPVRGVALISPSRFGRNSPVPRTGRLTTTRNDFLFDQKCCP